MRIKKYNKIVKSDIIEECIYLIDESDSYDITDLCNQVMLMLNTYMRVNVKILVSSYKDQIISEYELREKLNKLYN